MWTVSSTLILLITADKKCVCAAQDDVLSESSAPSERPSVGSLAQQSNMSQLGGAPRSGSDNPERHAQAEIGNAVGTAIGKPRVGSRTMMSPQQAAEDQQKTEQVRIRSTKPLRCTIAKDSE